MINRHNINKIFRVTKSHTIEYYRHSYFKNSISIEKLLNGTISKEKYDKIDIRYKLFKWYFDNNLYKNELDCIEFFRQKLKDIFEINEDVKIEIKNAKINARYKNRPYTTILNMVLNMKIMKKIKLYIHMNMIILIN